MPCWNLLYPAFNGSLITPKDLHFKQNMHTARENVSMIHCLRKTNRESHSLTAKNDARQKFMSSTTQDGANFYSSKTLNSANIAD